VDYKNTQSEMIPRPRFGHAIVSYFNYILLFGGYTSMGEYLNDLWVFKIKDQSWTKIESKAPGSERFDYPSEMAFMNIVMV
jgi:hypothetical protein